MTNGRGVPLPIQQLFTDFEGRLERALEQIPTPGLNAAVLIDDDVVWRHAIGLSHFGPATPLTVNHLHRIGSITKLFTAHAILMLQERGQLDIDRPVRSYLPDLRAPGTEEITLRHILCHGSGLASNGGQAIWATGVFPDTETFRADLTRLVPVARPMRFIKYSNVAVSMLGLVIAAVSGRSYEEFMLEEILAPLGMDDTVFDLTAEQQRRFAHGHWVPPLENRFEETPHQDLKAWNACGMLASSAGESLRIAGAQWTNPLLAAETIAEMHRLHALDGQARPWDVGYGLGWRLFRYRGEVFAGHGGGYVGNRCQLELSLKDRVAVALYANCGAAVDVIALTQELLFDTVQETRRARRTLWSDSEVPAALALLVGHYSARYWGSIRIEHEQSGLVMALGGEPWQRIRLFAEPDGGFLIESGLYANERITVESVDDGRATHLIVAGMPYDRL